MKFVLSHIKHLILAILLFPIYHYLGPARNWFYAFNALSSLVTLDRISIDCRFQYYQMVVQSYRSCLVEQSSSWLASCFFSFCFVSTQSNFPCIWFLAFSFSQKTQDFLLSISSLVRLAPGYFKSNISRNDLTVHIMVISVSLIPIS
jgi:hypothetical protein